MKRDTPSKNMKIACGNQVVRFQKISIPTPWKVIGNSEGDGGLKSMKLNWKFQGRGEGEGGGGGKPGNLQGGDGYFLEPHITSLNFGVNRG